MEKLKYQGKEVVGTCDHCGQDSNVLLVEEKTNNVYCFNCAFALSNCDTISDFIMNYIDN